jgi:E3 ubiquitin-protein ligase HERC3
MGSNLPTVDLGTGRTVIDMAAAYYSTCAILDNNQLKCWGNNDFGQLGLDDTHKRGDQDGEMGDNLPAVNLGTGRTAKRIYASGQQFCALLDNNTIKCWGFGTVPGYASHIGSGPNQMGDNLAAINLGTGRTVRKFGMAFARYALLDDDSVKCWGSNSNAKLGLGHTNHMGDGAGEMGDSLPVVLVE